MFWVRGQFGDRGTGFVLGDGFGGPAEGRDAVEDFPDKYRIAGYDPSGFGGIAIGRTSDPDTDFEAASAREEFPEVFGFDCEEGAGEFFGRGVAMFDQVIAESREGFERDVLGFIFEEGGNLMAIESGIFDDGLDGAGSLLAVWGVSQQFRQPKSISHEQLCLSPKGTFA